MYTNSRDKEVKLLKKLWTSQPVTCPKCGNAQLEHLHKKAKKAAVTGDVLPAVRYTEQFRFSKSCQANKLIFKEKRILLIPCFLHDAVRFSGLLTLPGTYDIFFMVQLAIRR